MEIKNMLCIRKQFRGIPFRGIIHQKAQRVEAPERGISFNRPERFVVNTPIGQLEVSRGDWILEFSSGNLYVIKDIDMADLTCDRKKEWWKLW